MKWVHSVSNSVFLLHKIVWMPCFKQLSNPTGLYHARVEIETNVICFFEQAIIILLTRSSIAFSSIDVPSLQHQKEGKGAHHTYLRRRRRIVHAEVKVESCLHIGTQQLKLRVCDSIHSIPNSNTGYYEYLVILSIYIPQATAVLFVEVASCLVGTA